MADPFRRIIRTTLSSPAWARISRWIRGLPDLTALEAQYGSNKITTEVIAYFGDGEAKTYQLTQWLPVLEELNKTLGVTIVLRKASAIAPIASQTSLPIVYHRRFLDLMNAVHASPAQLAIYVNNGATNFQLLGYAPMVHVHVNHGESDKVSMVSNQAKAYDRVLVAGAAAIDRHHRALIDFDFSRLIPVGRPQLDIERESSLPSSSLRTVMYAPTWEGENDANNYTSVDAYGPDIVRAALELPESRLIYKPHPRVTSSSDERVAANHQVILKAIEEANSQGGENLVALEGDILAMFDDVDLMVTDVSSVGLDFLYLRPEKPLVITDRRNNRNALLHESPVARAATVVDASNIEQAVSVFTSLITDDAGEAARREMRTYYFGDGPVGSSKKSFIEIVGELVAQRKTDRADFDENYAKGGAEAG